MAPPGRRRGQLGHARRVADQVGRGEVGEVAHRSQGPVDPLALQGQSSAGLTGERLLPGARIGVEGQEFGGRVGQRDGHGRVERASRPPADHPGGELRATEHPLERGIACHRGDPHRQRDLLAPGPAGQALAVPALDQVREQALHGRGQAEPVGQHLRHLAERGDMGLDSRAALACHARPAWPNRRRAARAGECPHDPAVRSGVDPNLTGMAWVVSASSSPKVSAATSASAVQPT